MMAAAQAAAEAALQEAATMEAGGHGGGGGGGGGAGGHYAMEGSGLPDDATMSMAMQNEDDLRLLQALQAAEMTGQMDVLQELLGSNSIDPDQSNVQQLLQLLAQREQEQQIAAAEAAIQARPDEHYITVAENGTILEATKMVTGFPADALLMTSAYDDVYDEDLPGLLCVKTKFWDKGVPDVHVYIRRRTIEGDWVWLQARAVSFVDAPVSGMILLESRVHDEDQAYELNRVIRIVSILVQAVEAAQLNASNNNNGESNSGKDEQEVTKDQQFDSESTLPSGNNNMNGMMMNPADHSAAASMGSDIQLRDLQMGLAGANNRGGQNDPVSRLEQELMDQVAKKLKREVMEKSGGEKNVFDPFSIMEAARKGVRLDLGMTQLFKPEVKMISLVLSGKVSVDELLPFILNALQSGQGLTAALRLCERNIRIGQPSGSYFPSMVTEEHLGLIRPPQPGPPPISVINLSYTYVGNKGIDILSEVLHCDDSALKTMDVSFCGIDDKGFVSLSKALIKRKRKLMPSLRGIILSGNYISSRAATELGAALSPESVRVKGKRARSSRPYASNSSPVRLKMGGYETEDSGESEDEFDEDDFEEGRRRPPRRQNKRNYSKTKLDEANFSRESGLQVIHVSSTSMKTEAMNQFLHRLGPRCPIQELNLSSNDLGAEGAMILADFLQGKRGSKDPVMPYLDRLDLSNNKLGDDGTSKLTRVIARRSKNNFVELRLSCNGITAAGVETIMNKLLHHNLVSLSLNKNGIGDQGCQLVAASLQSMKSLSRLKLGFNQIGSRGVNSLMRSLIVCEAITFLELSGNVLKISGAVALAFTLAQHPRLEELDLDDCCLGQAAQCHIVAGIISNRWVPMKRLNGFAAGPPMVEIGALDEYAQSLSNEECFRIRKDEQMKTILQWMESNREARLNGSPAGHLNSPTAGDSHNFLTPDFVSSINEVHGTPSQNAYLRLLGWLSRIPFDEDELSSLQKYFHDTDGGDGERGSDGFINLKLRGDLLAALDSGVAEEIRDEIPSLAGFYEGSVGLDLDKLVDNELCFRKSSWDTLKGDFSEIVPIVKRFESEEEMRPSFENDAFQEEDACISDPNLYIREKNIPDLHITQEKEHYHRRVHSSMRSGLGSVSSTMSNRSANRSESDRTVGSVPSRSRRDKNRASNKPRITMFPMFQSKLEELKATAAEMIELEEDPEQQEVILTQYAEASLTILRQLRYHCMNSGLDGWRQGGLKRKVLIVDDSNVTRKLVSRAFEKANFIVDTASNGAEGVEKLKNSIYDIAFMDIDMPVMNGFEATKKLRQWEDVCRPGARQPICALTAAYVDDFERTELMKFKEAGLDVMESKPCNIPRLFKVVDDVSPMFSDLSISVIQREKSESPMISK